MKHIVLAAALGLSACGATEIGQPTVQVADGYMWTVCETSVGLTGNGRMAGLGVTTRWGCAGDLEVFEPTKKQ